MKMYQSPEILILHLKKAVNDGYNMKKLMTVVDFPLEGLDLTNFVEKIETPSFYYENSNFKDEFQKLLIPPVADQKVLNKIMNRIYSSSQENMNEKNQRLLYDFFAPINHCGTLKQGYYYACAKYNNQWYLDTNSNVIEISPKSIISKDSQVLFYRVEIEDQIARRIFHKESSYKIK